jgi:hypothetical protein
MALGDGTHATPFQELSHVHRLVGFLLLTLWNR